MPKYKVFNHTADIGCEICGKTRKKLFANAVAAMFNLIIERKRREMTTLTEKIISIEGNDLEDLLINCLREVLYLFNGKGWLVHNCRILKISKKNVVAQLAGAAIPAKQYTVKTEIKAVTYHGLSIQKTNQGWKARVIFDV